MGVYNPSSLIKPVEEINAIEKEEEIFFDVKDSLPEPANKEDIQLLTLSMKEASQLLREALKVMNELHKKYDEIPLPKAEPKREFTPVRTTYEAKYFPLQVTEKPKKSNRIYTPIGIPYAQMFEMLSESGEIKPLEPRPFESLKRTDIYYCQYR